MYIVIPLLFYISPLFTENSLNFIHHSDIVKKVKFQFENLKSYKAKVYIRVKSPKKSKTLQGKIYYQKNNKLRLDFVQPYGDYIISDGKNLWVYIHSLNAVGLQKLDKNKLYNNVTKEGLVILFQKYHYNFYDDKQPQKVNDKSYYTLFLKEKVSSGGYHQLILYVNSKTYWIEKIVGKIQDKTITLELKKIEKDVELPRKLFRYKNKGNTKTVENPLTIN